MVNSEINNFQDIYENIQTDKKTGEKAVIQCQYCKKQLRDHDLCWLDDCDLKEECNFDFECKGAVCFGCRNKVFYTVG